MGSFASESKLSVDGDADPLEHSEGEPATVCVCLSLSRVRVCVCQCVRRHSRVLALHDDCKGCLNEHKAALENASYL